MVKLIQFGSAGVRIPNFSEIKARAEYDTLRLLIHEHITYNVTAYQTYSTDAFIWNGRLETSYDEILDQYDSDIVGFYCDTCEKEFDGDDVIEHIRSHHAKELAELSSANLHAILENMRKHKTKLEEK
jgi:5-methylcytosine-specific restriction endonuclease McrA